MIAWKDKPPTYEEWCEALGYDPDDDRHWETYCEFTIQWEDN